MQDIEGEEPGPSLTSLESPHSPEPQLQETCLEITRQDSTARFAPTHLVQGPRRLTGLCITGPALQPSLENYMTSC